MTALLVLDVIAKRERSLDACIRERIAIIRRACIGRPAPDGYDDSASAAIADPDERAGLPADARSAIEYLEGVADTLDVTALELVDEYGGGA